MTILDYYRARGINISANFDSARLIEAILNAPRILEVLPDLNEACTTLRNSQTAYDEAVAHYEECNTKVIEAEHNLEVKQKEANTQFDTFDKALQDVVLPVTVITPNTINGTGTGPFKPVISPLYPPVQKAVEECTKAKEDLDKARADLAEADAQAKEAAATLLTQIKGVVLVLSVTLI